MDLKMKKDNKIQWIGENKLSWEIVRAKYIFRNKSSKNHIGEELLSVNQKEGVIRRSELDVKVWNPSEDISGYKLVENGNFIISLRSFEGGLELSKIRGLVSPAYTVLEKIQEVDNNFFWWMMKSNQFIVELNKHVSGIRQGKNIGWDDFSNIYLLKPPYQEQKKISAYLDKKTKQIDSLIGKIEKKIELLKEQKTALINQYVTKGLDLNIQMKDSGVDWIGEIPSEWRMTKIKYLSSVELSTIDRHQYKEENRVKICHYPEAYKNEYISKLTELSSGTCSDYEFEKYSLKKNDILLTKDSESPDDIGIPTFVSEDLDNTVCGYHLSQIRINNKLILPEFLYRFLESKSTKDYFFISSNGITRYGLGKSSIQNLLIIFPTKDLQIKIIKKIKDLSKFTENSTLLLKNKIVLLKEYRQSLISSIVTGKIGITEDMT